MAGSIYEHRASMKTAVSALTAGGYNLSASRIKLGHVVHAANADFIRQMATAGPYLNIHAGGKRAHEDMGTSRVSTYEVRSDLYVGLDRNADDDLTNLEALLEAIDEAWIDWPTTWDEPEIDVRQNSAMAHVVLTSEVLAGC
jgi:hypothetical protein